MSKLIRIVLRYRFWYLCWRSLRFSFWLILHHEDIVGGSFNKKKGNILKKKIFFFTILFHKCKYRLELVYSKNYFSLEKIFLLRLFKLEVNQLVSKVKKRSVKKFFLMEKYKPSDIYIFNVCGQAYFCLCFLMNTIWLNHNVPKSKTQSMEWKHTDYPLKCCRHSSKIVKVMLPGMKELIVIDILEKHATLNSAFPNYGLNSTINVLLEGWLWH